MCTFQVIYQTGTALEFFAACGALKVLFSLPFRIHSFQNSTKPLYMVDASGGAVPNGNNFGISKAVQMTQGRLTTDPYQFKLRVRRLYRRLQELFNILNNMGNTRCFSNFKIMI
jgi:hypothetical protein